MAIHPSEWLAEAKRLGVGGKRRIRHGAERTNALDVFNNADSWSCYCHRCHENGWVPKEHQQLRTAVVEPDRVQPVPATALRLAQATAYEQRRIWELLVRKGCPPGVLPEDVLWFDRASQRLLIRSGNLALGRALDDNRLPKWLPYGEWHSLAMVWQTRVCAEAMAPAPGAKPVWVIAEDALSAYKIAKAVELYTPNRFLNVVATLGTSVTDRFLPYIAGHEVVCMYDGDIGGQRGYEAVKRRLAVWGQPVHDCRPIEGDPKNHDLAEIAARLEKFT